jgi:hypothetical protein
MPAVAGNLHSVFCVLAIGAAIIVVIRCSAITGRVRALVVIVIVCHGNTDLSK